jgi:hypothetical protein
MNSNALASPASTRSTAGALPNVDIRFSAVYAWLFMGIGTVFFVLGLLIAFVFSHGSLGFGLFIVLLSVAAVIGANFWRKHLHVVAQLTPNQLILRRDGAVNWEEIATIEVKEIRASYHGARTTSEWICIKLKTPRPSPGGLQGFMLRAKAAITGYDIIVGVSELSCTAEWFVTECRKRMGQ